MLKYFWINHPRSATPDAMLTLATYSTLTVLAKLLLNGVSMKLGSSSWTFGVVDAGLIGAVLTPTLGAYVIRKMKDSPANPTAKPAKEEG
jgi:hypothetical protein